MHVEARCDVGNARARRSRSRHEAQYRERAAHPLHGFWFEFHFVCLTE